MATPSYTGEIAVQSLDLLEEEIAKAGFILDVVM